MKKYIFLLVALCPVIATAAEKANELAKRFVSNILELRGNDNPTPFQKDTEAFQWHCSCNALASEVNSYTNPLNTQTLTKSSIKEMLKAMQPTVPTAAMERYRMECKAPLDKALYKENAFTKGGALNHPLFDSNSRYKNQAEERRTIQALALYARKRDGCLNTDHMPGGF